MRLHDSYTLQKLSGTQSSIRKEVGAPGHGPEAVRFPYPIRSCLKSSLVWAYQAADW